MDNSLAAFDKVLADVQKIKEQGSFLPDCSTKDGYDASKNFVLKVTTPARTALSKAHKDAKAFYLEGGRAVDAKKNELMSMLEEIQKPHQDAYKAIDEEKKRIKAEKEAAIKNGFDTLNGYLQSALNSSSSFISDLIDECSNFDLDPNVFGNEIDRVMALQSDVIAKLTDGMSQALRYEDMQRQEAEMRSRQAALDEAERKQREEAEAQERAEREAIQREKIREEAEQAAAAETERLKQEAIRSEEARVAAEQKAIIDAENAKAEAKKQAEIAAEQAKEQERQRQEAESKRLKAEADAREADKKNRAAINNQVMQCLIAGGLDAEQAKLAVKLIAGKKVAHTQIFY